jgi:hypothetical protein
LHEEGEGEDAVTDSIIRKNCTLAFSIKAGKYIEGIIREKPNITNS